MFSTPVKHVRITSMEELLKFSYWTTKKAHPLTRHQNNGQIAFAVETGDVYVTPYRPEIHDLLANHGYMEGGISVPFPNGVENCSPFYKWLSKIAEEECWAYTHEKAFQISKDKGITPVSYKTGNLRIREITHTKQPDLECQSLRFSPLTSLYLMNDTEENIGTYIVLDERTVLLCDEYGRTFLVKAKIVINDFVNALLEAGYSRTAHPERYVYVSEDHQDIESTSSDE